MTYVCLLVCLVLVCFFKLSSCHLICLHVCVLPFVTRRSPVPHATCHMGPCFCSRAFRLLCDCAPHATTCVLGWVGALWAATCQHATSHMPHATCHMPHAACRVPHATCHMPHTTYHMPCMQGESDRLASALSEWLSSVQPGLASLDYYTSSQGKQPGENADSGVSLVALPETETHNDDCPASSSSRAVLTGPSQFVFVQWTEPGVKGRIADYDETTNRVKCIVPVGAKRLPIDFTARGASILIPATCVRVLRERRVKSQLHDYQPNQVPAVLLRLMDMLRAGQSKLMDGINMTMGDSVPSCFVCARLDLDLPGGNPSDTEDMSGDVDRQRNPCTLCPVCMLCSHSRCCDKIFAEFQSRVDHSLASWPYPSTCKAADNLPQILHDMSTRGAWTLDPCESTWNHVLCTTL